MQDSKKENKGNLIPFFSFLPKPGEEKKFTTKYRLASLAEQVIIEVFLKNTGTYRNLSSDNVARLEAEEAEITPENKVFKGYLKDEKVVYNGHLLSMPHGFIPKVAYFQEDKFYVYAYTSCGKGYVTFCLKYLGKGEFTWEVVK